MHIPKPLPYFSRKLSAPTYTKPPPDSPDFRRISKSDMALILACSNRASLLAQKWRIDNTTKDEVLEVNVSIIGMCYGTAHLFRRMQLRKFHESDDLAFLHEHASIMKNMGPGGNSFPLHVPLRFAVIGEKLSA